MPYVTSIEKKGIEKGRLEGIQLALELKFDVQGLKIFEKVKKINNIEFLKVFMEKIKELNDFLQKNKPIPKKITNKKLSKPITAKSKKSVARK